MVVDGETNVLPSPPKAFPDNLEVYNCEVCLWLNHEIVRQYQIWWSHDGGPGINEYADEKFNIEFGGRLLIAVKWVPGCNMLGYQRRFDGVGLMALQGMSAFSRFAHLNSFSSQVVFVRHILLQDSSGYG